MACARRAAWRLRAIVTLAGLFAVGLTGCSTLEAINPWTAENLEAQRAASAGRATTPTAAAPRAAAPAAAPTSSADPLLRLVATMPLTGEQSFREPVTGENLRVRVLRSYAAASGRQCREYQILTARDERQVRVACSGTDGWVQARRLRQEAGSPGTASP